MLYTDTTAAAVASKRGAKKRQQQQQHHQQHHHHAYHSSDGYIEKHDFRGQPTVVVRDFEPEVFKQLVHYTHTGGVVLQARTLLGLMNAADHYGLEELKQACIRFMERCIAVDSVCSLLSSAEKYIQYKSTKILVQKIFEFVDVNAEAILALRGFFQLPQHVVRIVLGRDELAASEISKFDAAYNWCLHNSVSEGSDEEEIRTLFEPFVDVISYNRIPARLLMQRVKPAGVVSDAHILTALAFQADPTSISPVKQATGGAGGGGGGRMQRRMTPTMLESDGGVVISPQRLRQQKKKMSPSEQPGHFRRVQSSGVALERIGGKERKLSSSEHALAKPRNARAGSVPLNSVGSAPNLDTQEGGGGGGGGGGGVYSRGSEVHPVRAHHVVVKDRMDSQSSSHASLLSMTPPFSPAHSPSTTASYQGSLLSGASSSDSVPILSTTPHGDPPPTILPQEDTMVTTSNGSSGGGGGGVLSQGGDTTDGNSSDIISNSGNSKKMTTYNPLVLDAIVNLSSNVVEV